jgi:hypothetical protein
MMNVERLTRLAELLKDVHKDAFDITTFTGGYIENSEGGLMHAELRYNGALYNKWMKNYAASLEKDLVWVPHNCGATACACGYAGLDPWFRDHGFVTTREGRVNYTKEDGTIYTGYEAMMYFFDLSTTQTDHLFTVHGYPSSKVKDPRYVSCRITAFLKANGEPDDLEVDYYNYEGNEEEE